MKHVLISINPKWCELIANGEKTIEIRKTKPKIETPFKCYIYCTKERNQFLWSGKKYRYIDDHSHNMFDKALNGKVIGEFVCDEISKFTAEFTDCEAYEDIRYHYLDEFDEDQDMIVVSNEWNNPNDSWICTESCLSFDDFKKYIGINFHDIPFYSWHISELKIYDEPKELKTFKYFCPHKPHCETCKYSINEETFCGEVSIGCDRRLQYPPQSWCYVEEI